MKRLIKIIGYLAVILLLLLGMAIALPYFFKDQIVLGIRNSANDQIHAKFDFDDVSLSLIRSFPELQIKLKNASIVGIEAFEGITLYQAEQTIVNLDLISVLKKDQIGTITSAILVNPKIQIITNDYGESNYDIVKSSTNNSESKTEYEVDLSAFEILGGDFKFSDEDASVYSELSDINLTGNAQLRGSKYFIDYIANVTDTNLKAIGVNYLRNAQSSIQGQVEFDIDQAKYKFIENSINLNELDLVVDGWVQTQESSVLLDINFESKDDQFRKIWSLIPGVYTADYADAKIDGLMKVIGYVRGTYNSEKDQLPSFDIQVKANNGSVRYPGFPKTITGINTDITIASPGSLEQLGIRIPFFRFEIDKEPFEGKFIARQILNNPDLDMRLNGGINFKDFSSIVPLDGIRDLSGILDADVQVNGKMSDISNKAFQNTLISGYATLTDFILDREESPKTSIEQMTMNFSPKRIEISNLQGKFGSTAFNANGTLDNVIAFFIPGQDIKGKVQIISDVFDLNEWYTGNVNSPTFESEPAVLSHYIPPSFQLDITAESDLVKYGSYELQGIKTQGLMINGDLRINEFVGSIYNSRFQVNGVLENVLNYALSDGHLTGSISFNSDYFDFNPFLESNASESRVISMDEDKSPVIIPDNVSISIKTKIDKLDYDNLTISDIDGTINVANGEARMQDLKAKAMDGEFTLNGGYMSKEGEQPKFDLAYTLDRFDFQKTFQKVNTFRFIAPIGKFIKGNFNSTLKMQGSLTDDLLPDLTSLNADGFVETFNGLLADFKPLDLLSQFFDTKDVQKMRLTDTRNTFSVKDGTVTIREFTQKVKDIDFRISGTHNLNQEINYLIKSKIPKELLAKSGVTEVVDQGLSTVNTQLNKLGFNINNGKYINLNFILTGTITNPKIEMRVVGMDGETDITNVVTNEIDKAVETVKDSIKSTVNTKIDSTERLVDQKKNQLVDTAAIVINQKVDSLKANVQTEVDKLIKEKAGDALPDSLKIKIDSILKTGTGKEIEKVKDILKDFNPFKKKKKKTSSG